MRQTFQCDVVCGETDSEKFEIIETIQGILNRHGYIFSYFPVNGEGNSIIIMEKKIYDKES